MAQAFASSVPELATQCRAEPMILDGVRPDLCAALEQIILTHMENDRGRRVGSINVGGWKSGEDFFYWPDAAVQELRQAISEIVGTTSLLSWAMVNRAGSKHPRHQHRAAILSGVFYVAIGDPEASVPTIFECPCDARMMRGAAGYSMEVEPHPGRVVICRGETWHSVPAYMGDLPRITIAFDVRR